MLFLIYTHYLYPILSRPVMGRRLPLPQVENVCNTAECNRTANWILENIDPNVNPCDNFYQFACGKYIAEKAIPSDKQAIMSSHWIYDTIQEQLKVLIEKPIQSNEPKPFVLLKKLYRNCMNRTLSQKNGVTEIMNIIEKVGGWPVLKGQNWNENFDWQQIIHGLKEAGLFISQYIFNLYVSIDYKNSSKYILYLDQPDIYVSQQMSPELVRAYCDYMVDVASYFGAEKTFAKKDLSEALNFETQLSEISESLENTRDFEAMYHPMTMKQLQQRHPFISWLKYINAILAPHTVYTDKDTIIVKFPTHLTKFERLMTLTPKRTLANYLLWRTIGSNVKLLPRQLRNNTKPQYNKKFSGADATTTSWQQCVKVCTDKLNIAASALYVRNHFDNSTELYAKELITNIHERFRQTLRASKWIDQETKRNALDKLDMMVAHIGHPSELLDNGILEEYHKGLVIVEDSYVKSILNINLFNSEKVLQKFRLPVNKTDWIDHSDSLVLDAFYRFQENSIQLPASILQGVYINKDRPQYMNYGGFGFVIGHEITHGFDDQGKQFDKNGDLVNWWAPNTKTAFDKKAQCFVKQYNSYNVSKLNMHVNGINTQGENIADNGGARNAYYAYDKWVQTHGKEPQLPGLNYTGHQMFWIAMAQPWCAKFQTRFLRNFVLVDPHAPPKFRILGTLRNMNEFRKDFNCDKEARMNPKQKCRMW